MIIKRTEPRGSWTKSQKAIAVELLQKKIEQLKNKEVMEGRLDAQYSPLR